MLPGCQAHEKGRCTPALCRFGCRGAGWAGVFFVSWSTRRRSVAIPLRHGASPETWATTFKSHFGGSLRVLVLEGLNEYSYRSQVSTKLFGLGERAAGERYFANGFCCEKKSHNHLTWMVMRISSLQNLEGLYCEKFVRNNPSWIYGKNLFTTESLRVSVMTPRPSSRGSTSERRSPRAHRMPPPTQSCPRPAQHRPHPPRMLIRTLIAR
jgi:hypothetical protein